MDMPVNLSGQILKREAGLVAIVAILVSGAFFIAGKNNLIAYIFVALAAGAILIHVMIYMFTAEDDDWIEYYQEDITRLKTLHLFGGSPVTYTYLIDSYERFYQEALNKRKLELAEAIKKNIDELKNQAEKP